MKENKVNFLKTQENTKNQISSLLSTLKKPKDLHTRTEIAKQLWKTLFETAIEYISPNEESFDTLFSYFDKFVAFEELIFASDSFYRDHTLHVIWGEL